MWTGTDTVRHASICLPLHSITAGTRFLWSTGNSRFFVLDEEVIGCPVPQAEELNVSEKFGQDETQSPRTDDSTDVKLTAAAPSGTTSLRGDDSTGVQRMDTEVTATAAAESTSGDIKATAKQPTRRALCWTHLRHYPHLVVNLQHTSEVHKAIIGL